MGGLVMDGVRRRSQTGGILRLGPERSAGASVMAMPQTWAPVTGGFDGLRRVAQTIAAPIPQPAPALTFEAADYTIPTEPAAGRRFPHPLLYGLAGIPMLAAASVAGVRIYQAHQPAVATASASSAATTATAPAPKPAPAVATVPTESQSLQQVLDNFGQSTTYSLYVQDLKTGQLATVNPDRNFESASLYKLFVANSIYQHLDAGTLAYSDEAGGGTGNTVQGCLNLMITISDNGCGQALGGLLGWANLTQAMRAQGYDDTNLTGTITYTTPRDVARLYQRLYAGTLVNTDSTTQFLNLLKAQKVNNRLPQGLPAGTTFAHKTGDLDGYMHDAGIVFGPKTDYLVVMMGAPGAVPSDFSNLSAQLYNFFEK